MSRLSRRVVGVATALMIAMGTVVATSGAANAASPLCTTRVSTGDSHDHVFWVPLETRNGYNERCYLNQDQTRSYNTGTLALQDTLRRCYGKSIAVDGKFGPATRSALIAAQSSAGAAADGRYGPESRSKLKWPVRAGSHGGHLGSCERVAITS